MAGEIMGPRNLKITCCDLGPEVSAIIWKPLVPSPLYDDKLTLNINSSCNFFEENDRGNSTLFHEISHLCGTDDGESNNEWMSAHSVESIMEQDVKNWIYYKNEKRMADKCYCKK
jgi:hypothetical protein